MSSAHAGSQRIYHVGSLAEDRLNNPRLARLADIILRHAQRHEVHCLQVKLAWGRWRYVVIKASPAWIKSQLPPMGEYRR